jgi:putative oxidoreductase
MSIVEKFGPLVGRILIALLFVPSGLQKLTGFAGTVAYVKSAHLPLPEVGAAIAIVVELLVGLAFLVGFKTRYAALILAVFTVAAGLGFHQFWAMPADAPAMAVMMQKINFFKNLAIAGGLLFAAVHGGGAFSVDNRGK